MYIYTWDAEAPAGISQMCNRGKCEGTGVRVTSADKKAMFLLLSVKEIRRFYRTLRGQTRPRFLSL